MRTRKFAFEINWPLESVAKHMGDIRNIREKDKKMADSSQLILSLILGIVQLYDGQGYGNPCHTFLARMPNTVRACQ